MTFTYSIQIISYILSFVRQSCNFGTSKFKFKCFLSYKTKSPCISLVGAIDKTLLETCCVQGTKYATDSDTCEGYSYTVPGVGANDQFSCVSILKVCCMKQKQRDQCQSGKVDAISFGRCAIRDDTFGAEQYKVVGQKKD